MRLPRKAVLIRLLIYVPLIGFFGWRAVERYRAGQDAEDAAQTRQETMDKILKAQTRSVTLPDGTVQQVPVLTPEQAEELWGVPPAGDPEGASHGTSHGTSASPPAGPPTPPRQPE